MKRLVVAAGVAAGLCACSTVENILAGDRIDYRTQQAGRPSGLEIPPDLTQLPKDTRYQSGVVNASTFQAAASGPAAGGLVNTVAVATAPGSTGIVAPSRIGEYSIERQGSERWLHTSLAPEEVFPQIRAFWRDSGFVLVQDRADSGVLETDWAENRAKLPNDFIRGAIGKIFDSAYSTGELDKFRTRVERTPTGSDIFVTHRGMVELYTGQRTDSTVWQPRPADPQLEAEFLSRLMIRLGNPKTEPGAATRVATAASAAAIAATATAPGPARARLVDGAPGPTLQLDDGFDRAWRRVGVALDRSGFTVEDRDRTQGLYFVRYVDPAFAGREDPNLFQRMFNFVRRKPDDTATVAKYRVKVDGAGATSRVSVLDSTGKPENGEAGQRIARLLLEDLK